MVIGERRGADIASQSPRCAGPSSLPWEAGDTLPIEADKIESKGGGCKRRRTPPSQPLPKSDINDPGAARDDPLTLEVMITRRSLEQADVSPVSQGQRAAKARSHAQDQRPCERRRRPSPSLNQREHRLREKRYHLPTSWARLIMSARQIAIWVNTPGARGSDACRQRPGRGASLPCRKSTATGTEI
jgi:hypothetical protein